MSASCSACSARRQARPQPDARRALSDIIERAIALLDALDGDPEAEADGSDEMSSQPQLRGGVDARAA